jgi:hypothetical protein
MEPTILTRNNKKRGLITQSLYFRTLAMPCLNYYYDLFYKDKIKVIPRNLDELLTAILRPRSKDPWVWTEGEV